MYLHFMLLTKKGRERREADDLKARKESEMIK